MLDNADTTSVCSLLYLSQQNRVAVGLSNGRIFLVRSDASPSAPTMGEGSFVMSELGSSTVLHAITAVFRDEGRYVVCYHKCYSCVLNVIVKIQLIL